MKNTIIVLVVIVLLASGAFFFLNDKDNEEVPNNNTPDSVTGEDKSVNGTVLSLDIESVAVDGPAVVLITTTSGQTETILIPSMGILLCEANQNINDVFSVEVGDTVSVNGEVNERGEIIPCESKDHYFTVSK